VAARDEAITEGSRFSEESILNVVVEDIGAVYLFERSSGETGDLSLCFSNVIFPKNDLEHCLKVFMNSVKQKCISLSLQGDQDRETIHRDILQIVRNFHQKESIVEGTYRFVTKGEQTARYSSNLSAKLVSSGGHYHGGRENKQSIVVNEYAADSVQSESYFPVYCESDFNKHHSDFDLDSSVSCSSMSEFHTPIPTGKKKGNSKIVTLEMAKAKLKEAAIDRKKIPSREARQRHHEALEDLTDLWNLETQNKIEEIYYEAELSIIEFKSHMQTELNRLIKDISKTSPAKLDYGINAESVINLTDRFEYPSEESIDENCKNEQSEYSGQKRKNF